MQVVEIFCSRVLTGDGGSGFAYRIDDGAQVYIPVNVVNKSGIEEGGIATAKLIPNNHHTSDDTPWIAVFVDASDRPSVEVALDPALNARALKFVKGSGYASTREIAKSLKAEEFLVKLAMLALFRDGRVVKADVHEVVGQSKASFTVWAIGVNDFLA